MLLSVKLCIIHYLQCIIWQKGSENLEKSLCAKDEAENQHWTPVMFRPSGGSALKTGI